MNPYREFVIKLREKELEGDANLEIVEDVSPVLKEIISKIVTTKYKDGRLYSYYVDVKQLISSFPIFWKGVINDAAKTADQYSHTITKDDLLGLIVRTTNIQRDKQIDFGLSVLPVDNADERTMYANIQSNYYELVANLSAMTDKVNDFVKEEEWHSFIAHHMKMTLQKLYNLFQFTMEFIGNFLIGKLYELQQSLADIITHVCKNYKEQEEQFQTTYNSLHHDLYEKSKEFMGFLKLGKQNSAETIEANEKVEAIREKISKLNPNNVLRKINYEIEYWLRLEDELKKIVKTIKKLQNCQAEDDKEEAIYHSYECKELPGSKTVFWKTIGENFVKRREYIRKKLDESALALVTHFRFNNEVSLKCLDYDRYCYLDSYFHQVYLFKYGLRCYHMTSKGHLKVMTSNKLMFYQDENGRYTLDNKGNKVYQRSSCANFYTLDTDGRMQKIRKPPTPPKLPGKEEIETERNKLLKKESIPADKIKYIHDNFGHILPYVLSDVAKARPKDPINYLAHRLIVRSHNTPKNVIEKWKKEDEDYRNEIYLQRKEKVIAETKKWKAQFPKRELDADESYWLQAIEANKEEYFDYD